MRTPTCHLIELLALWMVACSAAATGSDHAGELRDCDGEQRVLLDCSSEVDYQGIHGKAGVDVMGIAGIQGEVEQRAIRRVSDQVADFVAAQTRACRDYNACVLSRERYAAEAAETRRRLQVLPALTAALRSARSERERVRALDQLYRTVVPDDKRAEEVTFELGMLADIPAELGGGVFSVAPGGAVPTGAKVRFEVNVSRRAYLYIFQTAPSGEVNVLFPDPRIGTHNPLEASGPARIPARKHFRVDGRNVGTENIYVVASVKPVGDLNAALAKVRDGQVTTLAQDQTLSSVATVAPPSSSQGCKRRALELEGDGGEGGCSRPRALQLDESEPAAGGGALSAPAGMRVRTAPGDDLIVTVFPFRHLSPRNYRSAGGTKSSGHRARGVIIVE